VSLVSFNLYMYGNQGITNGQGRQMHTLLIKYQAKSTNADNGRPQSCLCKVLFKIAL